MRGAVRRLVAMLVASALGSVVTAPADAALVERNARFCRAVDRLGEDVATQLGAEEITAEQAAEVAKALRRAAKRATRRVKRSMRTMARAYERIANGDEMADVVADDGEEFAVAAAKFAVSYIEECRGASVSE
jgi:hypothetical protein